jgi:peptidoglycan hydrolase CwlO-like protein
MKSLFKKFAIVGFSISISVVPILGGVHLVDSPVYASDVDDLEEELDELEKELAELRKRKQDLEQGIANQQNTQNSLSAQIRALANTIATLELEIEETEKEVELNETLILKYEAQSTEARQMIEYIEDNVAVLEATADDILRTIYIETRTNSTIDILLTSQESKSFLSQIQYHTALGAKDQNTLEELDQEKQNLKEEQQKIDDNKIEIEKLAEQIRKQMEDLEKDQEQLMAQKRQKDYLYAEAQKNINSYLDLLNNLSEEEQMLMAQQIKLQQELFEQIGTIPSGQYVVKGTIIGKEGDTGYTFGEHLHFVITKDGLRHWGGTHPSCSAYGCNPNPCNYLPQRGECGVAGSPLEWPMRGTYYLTSPWGPRWGGFHDAIDLAYDWSQRPNSDFIYATHSGWIQYGTLPCSGDACNGDCKYAIICEDKTNCDNGYQSGYFHLE